MCILNRCQLYMGALQFHKSVIFSLLSGGNTHYAERLGKVQMFGEIICFLRKILRC